MKNMTLDKTVKEYILEAIDNSGYDGSSALFTDKDKLQFLLDTFKSEYGWSIERKGIYAAFSDWIMGLPSSFNIAFENYRILELSKLWGSIPSDASEREEDKILANWFNFITVKTFQLFRKHKIA